jgi:hypothetical protein
VMAAIFERLPGKRRVRFPRKQDVRALHERRLTPAVTPLTFRACATELNAATPRRS